MKTLVSPQALRLLSSPAINPFLKDALREIVCYGLDTVPNANNPFFARSHFTLWWDDHSPLAIYHKKADPDLGNYALLFEKPLAVGLSGFVHRAAYFEALLPHCTEMTVA